MTTTIKLDPGSIRSLRARLNDEGFAFRALDHAHFQARGQGVVVSAYRSGKVVVAGKGEAGFLESHGLGGEPAPVLGGRFAGSDESGKGDYFGPLTVAAVVVDADHAVQLAEAGVRDCKKMSDTGVLRASAAIRQLCPHAVTSLMPPEYNRAHEEHGNVALFLSDMHAATLAEAIRAAGGCDGVVIDKFTATERLESALAKVGIDVPAEIRHRAEDHPAVAAASVLARAEFLLGLRELGNGFGEELPKGAGTPVDRAARRIFEVGGREALEQIAKIHFRTTEKVTGLF